MRTSLWKAAGLTLILPFAAGAVLAQSRGFITTRPDCNPGVQSTVNYIQGPDPILDANGDINILVDAGHCCVGEWEAIFNLRYPAAQPLATPRFHPIWATNDWGTKPFRDEHEAAFPSAVYRQGKWRVVYTSTFFPARNPNRERAARLDLDDLVSRATTSQVDNSWIEPQAPCQNLFSCTEPGTGPLATTVIQPNGKFFVYHPDKNNAACPSGWMRHKINPDMTLANPAGNGCLTFEGEPELPAPLDPISDIALGADNKLYMITRVPYEVVEMEEWVSPPPGAGRHWTRTGRKWFAPPHPRRSQGWVYSIWDGAYLKDSNRRIVEPRVVVSQISEGRTFEEIGNAALGKFQLYYWADAGASLPPNFGGEAHSCDTFGGNFEAAGCTQIRGWAWDTAYPNAPISVDLYDGAQFLANVPANLFRQDLLNAGKGNGIHAFSLPTPTSLKDGNTHTITAKLVASDIELPNSPMTLTCSCPWPVNHPNFCRDCGPCEIGEADCDSDAECQGSLICRHDVGADYGLPAYYDVCEGPCQPSSTTLCLDRGRFEATVDWDSPGSPIGGTGFASPHPTADTTGFFYFDFNDNRNLEIGVKVLDGSSFNGNFWVYHGAMTTFDYTLTVRDTVTGAVRVYDKTGTAPCGGGDVNAFPQTVSVGGDQPLALHAEPFELPDVALTPKAAAAGTCTENTRHFCLLNGRFKVQVKRSGIPQLVTKLSDLAGSAYFFSANNPEVFVKMLDPGPSIPWIWVFFGSMTDQSYNVVVTDTVGGTIKSYYPPAPNCGLADTSAFPNP